MATVAACAAAAVAVVVWGCKCAIKETGYTPINLAILLLPPLQLLRRHCGKCIRIRIRIRSRIRTRIRIRIHMS